MDTTTIAASYRCAIRTRYYGPGNVMGSRIAAWRADESSPRGDPMSIRVGWNHALDSRDNHRAAIAAYIRAHNAAGQDWSGSWVMGAMDDGYVAVWTPMMPTSEYLDNHDVLTID